MKNSTSCNY